MQEYGPAGVSVSCISVSWYLLRACAACCMRPPPCRCLLNSSSCTKTRSPSCELPPIRYGRHMPLRHIALGCPTRLCLRRSAEHVRCLGQARVWRRWRRRCTLGAESPVLAALQHPALSPTLPVSLNPYFCIGMQMYCFASASLHFCFCFGRRRIALPLRRCTLTFVCGRSLC